MDALLIVCFNSHITHFLTRADIFKKPLTRWLISTLNMIPIYRIRDGWKSLSENEKTFDACYDLFLKNEAVVIFPEGNHGDKRRLRPLTKGFARIAFESWQKNSELDISIVPVGLNYSNHQGFRESVSVFFGKPISAKNYFKDSTDINGLRDELSSQLKRLISHIENENQYDSIMSQLKNLNPDFLDPEKTNQQISRIENGEVIHTKQNGSSPINFLWYASVINFIPLFIWHRIRKGIKDPVFITSLKFGVGIFLFPAFYLLVGTILFSFFGIWIAILWLAISIPSMLLYKK